jgi:uncharacterized protein (DUF2267 family)
VPHRHVFEPYVEVARTWLSELSTSLSLSASEQPRALHALRAGLHAIRDRLPASEAVDLGAQLPTVIRGVYYDGWTLRNDPGRIRDRAAMIARVRRELAPDPRLTPTEVLRAVIRLLTQHVSPGEIEDVLATLPRSIADLWHELAPPDEDTPPRAIRGHGLTRRTGFSR